MWRYKVFARKLTWYFIGVYIIYILYKGTQDSLWFWIPSCGFRIPGTGFQYLSVELRLLIPIFSGIPDSLSCIPDSKTQDSGFHKQNFLGFRIPLQGLKLKFEFGLEALVLLDVNFWAHCRNFRRTAEEFKSTAYNVGSIYFKRKSKKVLSVKTVLRLNVIFSLLLLFQSRDW